jgi:hypothetical protein
MDSRRDCSIFTQLKRKIVKKLIGLLAAVAVLAVPTVASADNNASACGSVHGAFASVNGSFGDRVGHGGTPVYHEGAVGQDSGATGWNNSHTDCQAQA